MSKGAGGTYTGSWDGWEAVTVRYYPRLLAYGLRLTHGNPDDAQDVVQEALCHVLNGTHIPKVAAAGFSYLRTTMLRVHIDNQKKDQVCVNEETKEHRQRWVSYDDEQNEALQNKLVDEEAGEVMHYRVEDEQLRQRLRVAIGPLDKDEETLYNMHYTENMKSRDIAAELGKPVGIISFEVNKVVSKVNGRVRSKIRNNAPSESNPKD